MDNAERLRRLTVNDAGAGEAALSRPEPEALDLDPKTFALARMAAIVAVHGGTQSLGAQADAAFAAGASESEIVDVLVAIAPVVGLPCAVAAAPRLALALGYDVEESL